MSKEIGSTETNTVLELPEELELAKEGDGNKKLEEQSGVTVISQKVDIRVQRR